MPSPSNGPRPDSGPPSRLALRLFGPFLALRDGVALPKFPTRKESWLLALLVLMADAPIERHLLAGLLWPDVPDENGSQYLRRSLMHLRKSLGEDAERILSPTPRTLRLNLEGIDCDLLEFDAAMRLRDPDALRRAIGLYTAPLLLGCTEAWVVSHRERRQENVLAALEALAAHDARSGDHAAAAAALRRAIDMDPLRESAARALMGVLAESGQHAAAGEVYRSLRFDLHRQLNAEPDAKTVALSKQILAEARTRAAQPAAPAPAPVAKASGLPVAKASGLPVALSRLIGRDAERDSISERLAAGRLVTLIGTGGVGKTRLSVAVAEALEHEFPDGAWFVDLAPVTEPALLYERALLALRVQRAPTQTAAAALVAHLQSRRLLLVLDNCEHLRYHSSRLAQELLSQCAGLRILATSREPLGLPAELVWPVPGLAPGPAAELFKERAAQARFSFQVTEATSAAIDRICTRLEGIPLAIEMAAARTRGMSAVQIAARLDDVFRLLNQAAGNLEPRHQTLRATLDWSYSLLSPAERTLLARVSIFSGGWTLEAAEAVCAYGDALAGHDSSEVLLALVDRSLVVFGETADGNGRYRLLETTRAYAAERLDPAELPQLKTALARHLHAVATDARAAWTGPDEKQWLDRLELELPNIRVALAPPLADDILREKLDLRLPETLLRLWWRRAHIGEGRRFLADALVRRQGDRPDGAVAAALNALGVLTAFERDYAAAFSCYHDALQIRRTLQDQRGIAVTLRNVGNLHLQIGDPAAALASLEECLAAYTALGDTAKIASVAAEIERVRAAHEGGRIDVDNGGPNDLDDAVASGSRSKEAIQCVTACLQHIRVEKLDDARAYIRRALIIRRDDGDKVGTAEILEIVAIVHAAMGRNHDLPYYYAAAARLRVEIGCPIMETNRIPYDQNIMQCRALIGDPAFEQAWLAGTAATLDEALDRALEP